MDAVLKADLTDVAVLAWPPNVEVVDVDAMFRSLVHGKRVVNGCPGSCPPRSGTDLRGRFRASHAFVGVKGAAPGTALEGAGPRRVALAVGETHPEEFLGERPVELELTAFALRGGRRGAGDREDGGGGGK